MKGSFDSIPLPSVKIQIMGGKLCSKCKGKTLLGSCQQTFCFQKFVDNAQQCFAFTPQSNFPAHDLNFHWRWRRWIESRLPFKVFFTLNIYLHFCKFRILTLLMTTMMLLPKWLPTWDWQLERTETKMPKRYLLPRKYPCFQVSYRFFPSNHKGQYKKLSHLTMSEFQKKTRHFGKSTF